MNRFNINNIMYGAEHVRPSIRRHIIASTRNEMLLQDVPEMQKLLNGCDTGNYDEYEVGCIIYEKWLDNEREPIPVDIHTNAFYSIGLYFDYDLDEWSPDSNIRLVPKRYSDEYIANAIAKLITNDNTYDLYGEDKQDVVDAAAVRLAKMPHTCYEDTSGEFVYIFFKNPKAAFKVNEKLIDRYPGF